MIDNKLVADFKRPKNVQYQIIKENSYTGNFLASPYERGFATTIGNSLRRTLLAGLPGYAIVAVKFEGINNQFQNIPGVLENTTNICLNFKSIAIALKDETCKSKTLTFHVKDQQVFTAGKLAEENDQIVIGNPDLVLFHANKTANFSFDIQISFGRGYIISEDIENNIEVRGTIALDADYSPVNKVSFSVEKLSIGFKNDFEKLLLNIETNGLISPSTALNQAAQILKECYLTFNDITEYYMTTPVDSHSSNKTSEEDKIYHESVHSLPVLIETHYFFKINEISQIGQLVTKSETYLQSKKRFNEVVFNDISERLKEKNLSLNMKGINYVEVIN